MEVMDLQEEMGGEAAGLIKQRKKVVILTRSPSKSSKGGRGGGNKPIMPRALTLGGKRVEPIHSDDIWFLEHLLRIAALIFFVLTLPFSLMFCFKVSCIDLIEIFC